MIRSRGGGGLYLHAMIAATPRTARFRGPCTAGSSSRGQARAARTPPGRIEDKEGTAGPQGAHRAAQAARARRRSRWWRTGESDIYEAFTRRPATVDLLIRATKDRNLGATSLFAHVDALPVAARMELALPAKPGRKAREATLVLRFANVELRRPRNGVYKTRPPARASIWWTRARSTRRKERRPLIGAFTTHPVSNAAEAFEIANLYRRRWAIEQLFRAMKTQGFDVEGLRIEEETPLRNLAMAIFIAAVVVNNWFTRATAPATRSAPPDHRRFRTGGSTSAEAFSAKLEGKTEKQKNPHPKGSLAYAAWVCARLGGWNCYYGKPGPITMLNGWREFQAAKQGVALLQGLSTMCEFDSPRKGRVKAALSLSKPPRRNYTGGASRVFGPAPKTEDTRAMSDHSTPHYHNQPGAKQVRVGAKEFMCVGALPPFDHPHVFIDMGAANETICPYCSTLYVYDAALHGGADPAECVYQVASAA